QTRDFVSSSRPRNSVSTALLNSSAVSTRPTQPRSRHHSSRLQPRTIAANKTPAATKKCTKKLECPRTPSLMPRKASANLPRHERRGLGRGGGSSKLLVTVGGCKSVMRRHRIQDLSRPSRE